MSSTASRSHREAVVLRLATAADDAALRDLAALDSAAPGAGPHLVAEVDGRLRAALSLDDGRVVADPFHHTAGDVALLRARAVAEGRRRPARRRLRLPLRPSRVAAA